jgi:hypothetical protein
MKKKNTPSEQRHVETSKWDDCTNIMEQTKLLADELSNLPVAIN